MTTFRCPVCGHLHSGSIDFHFCPVCSAPAAVFIHDLPVDHAGYGHWKTGTRKMIRAMAETGESYVLGKGTAQAFLNMDGLIFLPAMLARLPLTEEAEVDTEVILGKKAEQPVHLQTPVLHAAMSYGALSKEAKMALALASSRAGTIANSGEGGMLKEERELADYLTLQYGPGRFGVRDEQLRLADMVEIKIAQGAAPGIGSALPAAKVSLEIATVRRIPMGITSRSPAIHPDIRSALDLSEKIIELRELTEGKPIAVKLVGGHLEDDLQAIFSQKYIPDVLVIDGGEGGTAGSPVLFKDHVGLPLIYSLPKTADFLRREGLTDRVTLIAAGGMRHAGDIAKAIALGAEGVYMGTALKIALGCAYLRQCHLGNCPHGIATQDKRLRKRLDVEQGAAKISSFIIAVTEEVKALTRACGKEAVHTLDRTDLAALQPELARITGVDMA
ncbi:MAG: glutamate synthase-related protein [Candidatus Electrothrix sp. YB6]